MISSLSRFASSFVALLGEETQARSNVRIDEISKAMLELLSPYVVHQAGLPETWFKIALATDIKTLWYLRSELLDLLSRYCGDQSARRKLSDITKMFKGQIPEASNTR